ncbi:WD40-repeat-containing domain protein [Xylaria sp. CBS 124048]|nr:WD40-repeat-containing domain protein [Xylaria sp. CBS 124048]
MTSDEPIQTSMKLVPLPVFKPDLYERAWQSIPHPTLPLIATAHHKSVTVFSLATFSAHSTLTNGHERSVRASAWKPNLAPHTLCLVTGSFDSTAGLWRWEDQGQGGNDRLEYEIKGNAKSDDEEKDWEFIVVLEGHSSEIKSVAFSPSGQYLATCSRDKSVWIWEDVGGDNDDDWETAAVLDEHEGDVKAVAWCPNTNRSGRGRYSSDVLASASYDETVRLWRERDEGEWACVAVLEGHKGTVWGVQWEPNPKTGRFPRLLTFSADCTLRIWTLKEEEDAAAENAPRHAWGGLGAIPNTMSVSPKEEWECTAILPPAHTRDIYSATWSADTGLIASVGSDGIIAIYKEMPSDVDGSATLDEATVELDGDVATSNGSKPEAPKQWKLISTTPNGHGPYEINHVTWCKRFDAGCAPENRGVEEMLVTTGDDGLVRPWQIV